MSKQKAVLSYSGGLDTSVAIKWLQEKYNLDIVTLSLAIGQPGSLEAVQKKALKTGAVKAYILDKTQEFAKDFIVPALKANAMYEGKYPLSTALGRPLIAKHLVEIAKKEKAKFIAHGCTGKGNDQVRFDVAVSSLAPGLKIIAPVREWGMSREEEIKYAKKHKIPISVTKKSLYSVDENLWGRSVECGMLEDPWVEPPEDAYSWTNDPTSASAKPAYVEIYWQKGVPRKLNGKAYEITELIRKLNKVGGTHGVGRIDQVENRLVGIKSREIYECPAATILTKAHKDLEALTLTRELAHYKYGLEQKYAELVYYGLWYEPLRSALDAFMDEAQESVTGTVRLKLYKGTCTVVGRKSPNSLYDYKLATYEKEDEFSHESAKGFVELWGLPMKVWAKKHKQR